MSQGRDPNDDTNSAAIVLVCLAGSALLLLGWLLTKVL